MRLPSSRFVLWFFGGGLRSAVPLYKKGNGSKPGEESFEPLGS
jgi:hypothetical protein